MWPGPDSSNIRMGDRVTAILGHQEPGVGTTAGPWSEFYTKHSSQGWDGKAGAWNVMTSMGSHGHSQLMGIQNSPYSLFSAP